MDMCTIDQFFRMFTKLAEAAVAARAVVRMSNSIEFAFYYKVSLGFTTNTTKTIWKITTIMCNELAKSFYYTHGLIYKHTYATIFEAISSFIFICTTITVWNWNCYFRPLSRLCLLSFRVYFFLRCWTGVRKEILSIKCRIFLTLLSFMFFQVTEFVREILVIFQKIKKILRIQINSSRMEWYLFQNV